MDRYKHRVELEGTNLKKGERTMQKKRTPIGNSFSSVSDLEKLLAPNYYKLNDISVVSKYIIMRLINS